MDITLSHLCLLFGFVSALVAGVFQSFSDFVMAGLARATPSGGIESMQHINRTVFRSTFLVSFLALVPFSVVFALFVAARSDGAGRALVIAATATYVLTVFVVTVARNVPMNQRLDALDAATPEARAYWAVYCRDWTRWNHVRTLGCAAASGAFLGAAATFASA
ncbi:MAG: anthrone oxygenase family protein, partial [Pseudomonadota bacterium]